MAGATWFHLIPGVSEAEKSLASWAGDGVLLGTPSAGAHHVIMMPVILALLIYLGVRYKGAVEKAADGGVVPSPKLDARGLVEVICDTTMGVMAGLMGEKAAKYFLPFLGTYAFFILFSNLMGLVPGLLPATDVLSTNAALAVPVFLATHWYGVKENGMGHFKHMMGPVLALAPLIFVIEVISHMARPVSLALRLTGNMIGDHKALTIFLGLTYVVVPVPMLALGFIVCVVQTLVFCLLSAVYIGMAIEHHEHGDEAHAH